MLMRFKLCLETAVDSIVCGIHGVLFSVDILVLDSSSCGICDCLVRCVREREGGRQVRLNPNYVWANLSLPWPGSTNDSPNLNLIQF